MNSQPLKLLEELFFKVGRQAVRIMMWFVSKNKQASPIIYVTSISTFVCIWSTEVSSKTEVETSRWKRKRKDGGRLFQQYVVAVYCAIEQSRIDFIRKHQSDIRSEYLSGLYDSISRGDREGVTVGGKIILPRSFTNRTRYLYSHYLDALAICRKLGNPQYFITFTCNVNWPEIKRYMEEFPQLTAADRPDIVCRVFE
ncbi:DNA helicase [Tanacetum coccineum]